MYVEEWWLERKGKREQRQRHETHRQNIAAFKQNIPANKRTKVDHTTDKKVKNVVFATVLFGASCKQGQIGSFFRIPEQQQFH